MPRPLHRARIIYHKKSDWTGHSVNKHIDVYSYCSSVQDLSKSNINEKMPRAQRGPMVRAVPQRESDEHENVLTHSVHQAVSQDSLGDLESQAKSSPVLDTVQKLPVSCSRVS